MNVKITEEPAAALAVQIIDRLVSEGFIAYFAGGCVRDALLGLHPKDFDVATNATPETVRHLFGKKRTLAIGAAFGVINVLPPRGSNLQPVEVATFRSDAGYSDGRRPDSVTFGDAQADALRRDFTINGIFFDPVSGRLIDYVGGQDDLEKGVVRAIGQADERIEEDKLRMLRGVRFAARFGFELETSTAEAIVRHAPDVVLTSGERIGQELRRMLEHSSAAVAMRLLGETGLADAVMPDCLARSVLQREVADLLNAGPTSGFVVGLAAMLEFGCSANPLVTLDDLFERWKLAGAERRAVQDAIAGYQTLIHAEKLPWSVVQPILAGRHATETLELAETWVKVFAEPATDDFAEAVSCVSLARERLRWPRERLDPRPLIDGITLQEMGCKPGPHFRGILAAVRAAQLDGKISTQDQAKTLAGELAAQR